MTQNWGSGFQGQFALANTQGAPVADWRLEFDMGASISSIWDAQVISHVGNHYVIGGASYNSTLPANGSTSLGLTATPGSAASVANITLTSGSTVVTPSLSASDAKVADVPTGPVILGFTVGLSQPSATVVKVRYVTADETAKAGTAYLATSGTLIFAPGETQKTVTVPVINSATPGPDETLDLILSAPVGATLSRSKAIGTISFAPPVSVQYTTTGNWGTGMGGTVAIKNAGTTALNAWSLAFDFGGQITSIWNASLVSHVSNHYVVQGLSYDSTIPAGGTVSFGFEANTGAAASPSNFVLTSAPPANHAPVAVADAASTTAGTPVSIDVLANDTDADHDKLSVLSFTQGANGSVASNTDGTLAYTPRAGYVGPDSFTYTLGDSKGGTATGTVSVTVAARSQAGAWPAHVYAPYVDTTLYPTFDMAAASKASDVKYFTLAFVVSGAHSQPTWGGYDSYSIDGGEFDQGIRSQVAAVRALGGDVQVSFGGASGQELAQSITSLPALTSAYQAVVDAYGLTHIDYDIEGSAVADHASIDRRSQAIAALQANAAAAGKSLQVAFTLPVLPTGLTADGLYVLQSAVRYGVKVADVNVMAMDYGGNAAPNPQGHMGDYAIQAATGLFNQLTSVYGTSLTDAQRWGMIGVTPMIGLNDDTTEVFDQAGARQLEAWAAQHQIGRISIWSLNRDRANARGAINYVDLTSSSLVQNTYDFSNIFKAFQG